MKKVGIWIRVSTEDQKRGDSPKHHLERAKAYAQLKDWDIVEEYHLEAVSGKSVLSHPEAIRMLRDIQRGHISGLIFSKIARLARNTKELLEFSELFQKYNADLISIHESIDTSSPSGRFFYTMISAMAQWEREEIVERIKSSVEVRAKMGKFIGGAIPFGYSLKDKQTLVIHPEEAKVRKKMFVLFLEHKRFETVANIINKQGYRTKRNKKFHGTTIKRLLKDPISKGLRRSRFTQIEENGKPTLRDKEEWVFTEVPKIVSEEIWEQVNTIIRNNEKTNNHPKNRKLNLFTGYAICACGGKMYVPSSNPKYTCRKCKRKIHVEDLETIFKEHLTQFLLSEEDLKKYFEGSHSLIKDKESEKEQTLQNIEKLNHKIKRLIDLHTEGQIETEHFNQFYTEPNEELKELKLQIPKLEGEIFALKEQSKSSEYIIEEAQSLYQNWEKFSKEEKRKIIEIITEKIIIDEDEITLNLNYIAPPKSPPFSSFKSIANGLHGLYVMRAKSLDTNFYLAISLALCILAGQK